MAKRDGLKPLAELLIPDVRHSFFVNVDRNTGEHRPRTVEDHYAAIEHYALNEHVPDNIATQYDVARNLRVYAWFEYRFLNVAEAQVLMVLELAIRERVGETAIKQYIRDSLKKYKEETGKKGRINNGLKTLIKYCRDHQLISNDGFQAWHRHATEQAYYKAERAQSEWADAEMMRTGAKSIELPEIKIERLDPDPNYDHVQHLIDHTNKIRNAYAHGSTALCDTGLYSFELVSDFINQLFSNTHLMQEASNDQ